MSDETHSAVWQAAGSLTFAGAASADFLQGYVTADCQRLSANALTPLALCTLKGRVLASGWAYLRDADVVMIVHGSLLEDVAQWLAPYLRFAKCSISQTQHGVGLRRDPAGPLIYDDWSVTSVPQSPATDLSDEINLHLINQAYAWITTPTSQRFLPQMLGLDAAGAVDFNKGCYLGQEVVARAQFRGAVKRHLQTVTWSGEQPAVGSQTEAGAVVIATATTAPGTPEGIALAVA